MKLGQLQTLKVEKTVPFGIYLTGEDPEEGRVLLPRSQVPEGVSEGDELEVFLYKDSEDRMIATRRKPKLMLHQVGYLRERVKEGQEVLVAVYLDKSERLCATMNVYPYLSKESPYRTGDQVTGIVYETSRNFGAFVAVDSMFSALIPRRELVRDLRVGDVVSARVTSVKPDGKLDLSIREKAPLQMDRDMDRILARMNANGGILPFNDRVAPEIIRDEMQMSKNEFKRAVGHLLKLGKIEIGADNIRIK